MKVLHLIGGGDDGGAKIHVLSLVKELGAHINVKIISFRPGMFANEAKQMGIDIEIIKTGNIFLDIKRVINIIKIGQYKIVHSHGAKANMISVITNLFIKVPRVTTVHSDYRLDYLQSIIKKLSFGIINTIALRYMNFYVAVSNTFKSMLIQRGFPKNKIFTLYNGVNFNKSSQLYTREHFAKKYKIDINDNDIIVGILARLHPVKGLATFVYAARQVFKEDPSVKFIIAGEGEERKPLEKMIKSLNLSKNIFLTGYINDPYEFMSIIDINVLTSISESFPYSILEGTMYKKATISSNVGGISDLIDDKDNGYLINPGEHDKLSFYILKLIKNPDLRNSMGEKIYQKAKSLFSLKNMCKTQIEIYESILEHTKKKDYDIIISGYYGFKNIGDDAMLSSIIYNLKNYMNDSKILILSSNPIESSNFYNVDALNRLNICKISKVMRTAKLFINGGGSLIQDNSSSRSLFYYLYMIWLAKYKGMKVMLYANGIGPLNKKVNKKIAGYILNKVDTITLRENMSMTELKNMFVTKPYIWVTADPALSLEPIEDDEVQRIFDQENIKDTNFIGFSVRKWDGFKKYEDVIAKIADFASENYGLTPIFIPMHYPSDVIISKHIISKMKKKGYVLQERYNANQIIGIMKKLKILVGMRLHALIFAVSVGTPIIGIEYELKVKAFMDYINQKYSCDVRELEFEKIKHILEEVITNYDSIKRNIGENTINFKNKSLENAKIAIELIK